MVDGFRVERLLGVGSTGAVFEATQVSLGRSVALRLLAGEHFSTPGSLEILDDQQRRVASLHHPGLVSAYAVGEWEGGRYVATRLIRGTTLAELLRRGVAPAESAVEPLGLALRAAHAAGLVHGRVSLENILVDAKGTAYLSDLGLGRPGSPEADLEDLAMVLDAVRGVREPPEIRRFRRLAMAVAGTVAVAALVLALALGGQDDSPASVPPPPAGTEAFGSSLTSPDGVVGCSDALSANTPGCTLAPTSLGGEELVVPRAGVIRSWVVRGGSGIVSLQVIRTGRRDSAFVAAFAQPARLEGSGVQRFASDVEVKRGDHIGIHLDPGASIGSRDAPGAEVDKWDGVLTADPRPSDGAVTGAELMLRADIEYGATVQGPPQLTGRAAETAPMGVGLSSSPMQLPVGGGVSVAVVEVNGKVAIDVFDRARLARIDVPDADPNGQFSELSAECGPVVPGGFCLRWNNPGDDAPLEHQYVVRGDGTIRFIG
jgi:hypothetical protein